MFMLSCYGETSTQFWVATLLCCYVENVGWTDCFYFVNNEFWPLNLFALSHFSDVAVFEHCHLQPLPFCSTCPIGVWTMERWDEVCSVFSWVAFCCMYVLIMFWMFSPWSSFLFLLSVWTNDHTWCGVSFALANKRTFLMVTCDQLCLSSLHCLMMLLTVWWWKPIRLMGSFELMT